MTLRIDLSALLRASDNESVSLFESFSKQDELQTKVAAPRRFTVPPLATQPVNLCDVAESMYTMLKTTKPIHVTVVFGGVNPPSPATQVIAVDSLLIMSSAITSMTIFNPNSGVSPDDDAEVDVIFVGS
jgi:hypothetical protein